MPISMNNFTRATVRPLTSLRSTKATLETALDTQ